MNLLKNNGWKCLWRGHPAQPTDQLKPPTAVIGSLTVDQSWSEMGIFTLAYLLGAVAKDSRQGDAVPLTGKYQD